MQNLNYKTFAGRLTSRIMLTVLTTMALIALIVLGLSFHAIKEETEGRYRGMMNLVSEKLGRILLHEEICARNVFDEVWDNLDSPEAVMRTLEKEIKLNNYTWGYYMAFEPGYFPQYEKWFEAYMSVHEKKARNIGSATHDYLTKDWYNRAKQEKNGFWTDPYQDEVGAFGIVCSFAMPLYDAHGRLAGICGSDMSLKWLMNELREIDDKSYSGGVLDFDFGDDYSFHTFIVTHDGTYIAHPDWNRVLKENVSSHVDDDGKSVVRDMLQMKRGQASLTIDGVPSVVYYAPLESVNWAMAVVVPRKAMWIPALLMIGLLLAVMVIGLVVVYLFCRSNIRQITRPLSALAQSADKVAEGNFDAPLPVIEHHDEVCMLRDSLAAMEHSLSQYMNDLKETTAQKASIERDLLIANRIQMGMLPKIPAKDERDDMLLYASLTPAKEVGGDLFDFHVRDEKLFFCIGDVSGKGVPASLFMAVTCSLFRNVSDRESMPDRIVASMNETIAEMNDSNMFVTLFVGVLDLPTGLLRYCNAGHEAPVLVGAGVGRMACDANVPVGLMSSWKFTMQETHIFTGTTIFLYTDGLTEAEDADYALFRRDRVLQVAAQALASQQYAPHQLIGQMTDAVHQFVGEAEQSDDLTMMAIQYTRQEPDVTYRKSIVLPNDIKEQPRLSEFVEEVCQTVGFSTNLTMKISLAIEEAVVNVMLYAYPTGTRGDISIEAVASDVRLKFTVIDSGKPFDPTTKDAPDVTLPYDERPVGGLGIHLVRTLMDSINYERVDGHNVLTVTKKLKQ